jgi:hypothetical protein
MAPELRTLTSGRLVLAVGLAIGLGACAKAKPLPPGEALTEGERLEAIGRARVWSPTDVAKVDLKAGPAGEGGFSPNAWVDCKYKEQEDQSGHSPKFVCETSPGHPVKVKYGPRNAEVFGEVLATRLFWALGFAADRMYPVRVRCQGCPEDPKAGPEKASKVAIFDPAAIEVKLPGRPMETKTDSGWKWSDLDTIGPDAPPDARAHRDALKLLVAFVQHTDSKAANQRLLCPKGQETGPHGCLAPILMVNDLGLTFGEAFLLIKNKNSVSLDTWSQVPVWKDGAGCEAQLKGSLTGSLSDPKISEAGRAFLARLLSQLTDAQLKDLFDTARVRQRSSDPSDDPSKEGDLGKVSDWVKAFKLKRAQIVDRRCPA